MTVEGGCWRHIGRLRVLRLIILDITSLTDLNQAACTLSNGQEVVKMSRSKDLSQHNLKQGSSKKKFNDNYKARLSHSNLFASASTSLLLNRLTDHPECLDFCKFTTTRQHGQKTECLRGTIQCPSTRRKYRERPA